MPACVAAACARDEHLGQGLQAGQGLPLVGGGDEAVRHVSTGWPVGLVPR